MAVTGYTTTGANARFVDSSELATALASKADTTALAAKANLASPTFTGDPKAPTPAASDNDTSIATTAFVKTAISGKADTTALNAKANATALTAALPTTLGTANQILKVSADGASVAWAADANTTYTAITQAEAENAASTSARLITGQRLSQAVAAYATVKAESGVITIPAPPATGTHTLQSAEGVLTWVEVTP